MANAVTTQVIEDGQRFNITKVDITCDTSDLAETLAVDFGGMSVTDPPSSEVWIDEVVYSIQDPISVQVLWQADTSLKAIDLAGRGKIDFWKFGGLRNNSATGRTGSIVVTTKGWASGTISGTIIFRTVKCRGSALFFAQGRVLTELSDSLQAETGAFINKF
jgi:hypothetical protein